MLVAAACAGQGSAELSAEAPVSGSTDTAQQPGMDLWNVLPGAEPRPSSTQGPGGGDTLGAAVSDSVAGGTQRIAEAAQPGQGQSQLRSGQAANAAGLQPTAAGTAASGLALP